MNKRKTIVFFILVSTVAVWPQTLPKIYNEELKFNIQWKGMNLGSVEMKTWVDEPRQQVKSVATVDTFSMLRSVYYISGKLGMAWDYQNRQSSYAFEEVYQGSQYQKRSYNFAGANVTVQKNEIEFPNMGFPKTGNGKQKGNTKETIKHDGFQDLLGMFYFLRTAKFEMKVGSVQKLKVLPAGSKKILILKVLGEKNLTDCPFFGKKKVYHVKTALADTQDGKEIKGGGDIFFKTKSPIEMYITADENYIPVKIWSNVDVIGDVYINLANYKQK